MPAAQCVNVLTLWTIQQELMMLYYKAATAAFSQQNVCLRILYPTLVRLHRNHCWQLALLCLDNLRKKVPTASSDKLPHIKSNQYWKDSDEPRRLWYIYKGTY